MIEVTHYMKANLIVFFGLLVLVPCYAGKGNGNRDEEHNCVALISHNRIIFDDLHGHVDELVDSWKHYSVYIPVGWNDLQILNINNLGDGDIFTSPHGIPNDTDYECRPYNIADEGCYIPGVTAGEHYFSLKANKGSGGYEGSDLIVDLLHDTTQPLHENPDVADNTRGFGWPGISQQQGTMHHYMINVPDGIEDLIITTSEGTGNADLYLISGLNESISTENYDERSVMLGNNEEIFYQQPIPGKYTIGVYAKEDIENIHLGVRYQQLSLGDAAPATSFAGSHYPSKIINAVPNVISSPDVHLYYIDVPENHGRLDVTLEHEGGDLDMYVAKNRYPRTVDNDCQSWKSGLMVDEDGDGVLDDDGFGYDGIVNEHCSIIVNEPGRYYILVAQYKNRKSSSATLSAKYSWTESKNDGTNTRLSAPVVDTCNGGNPNMANLLPVVDNAYLIEGSGEKLCLPTQNNTLGIQNYAIKIPENINSITIKTDHGMHINDDMNFYVSDNINGWPSYCDIHNTDPTQSTMCHYLHKSTDFDNNECIHLSGENIPNDYTYLSVEGSHAGVTLDIRYDNETGCNSNFVPIEGVKLIKDLEFGEKHKELKRCIFNNYSLYTNVLDVKALVCASYRQEDLDLSNTNFDLLKNFKNLTRLILSYANITDISSLPVLPNLRVLDLSHNNIKTLNGIENLSNVSELYIKYNSIEDIDLIGNLTNLYTLYAVSNNIYNLRGVENLLHLKYLLIGDNLLEDLTPLNNLTHLEKLSFRKNPLTGADFCNDLQLIQHNNPGMFLIHDPNACSFAAEVNVDSFLPVISNVAGSGPYPNGTREIEMTIETNIDAKCRYNRKNDSEFEYWNDDFISLDNRIHTAIVTLTGDYYQFKFIRCQSITTSEINTLHTFPINFTTSVLSKPKNFQVDQALNLDGNFTLTWDAVDNAGAYYLTEQINGGLWQSVNLTPGALNITLDRPVLGRYVYRISACNDEKFTNCGAFSSEAIVSVGANEEHLPPVINYIAGSGPYPDGTRKIKMKISTNLDAKCRFNRNNTGRFEYWSNDFVSIDKRTHEAEVTLYGDYKHLRYIRCKADATAYTSQDYEFPIKFAKTSVLSKPHNLQVNQPMNLDGNFTLTWDAVDNVGAYYLTEQVDGGLWQQVDVDSGMLSVSLYRPNNGRYLYQISACTDETYDSCGAFSQEVIVSVGADETHFPPVISYVSGSGPHPPGTSEVEMVIKTNIDADCRCNYNDIGKYKYWNKAFETSDKRIHTDTTTLTGNYNPPKYIRCKATATGYTNTKSFVFGFSSL